jgi:predicted dehydrogenase
VSVLLLSCVIGAAFMGGEPVRLMTLDPGHFHAALIQKEMLPGVDPLVHVYAPLGPDLAAHLARVARYNGRAESPTSWRLEVHASPDFLERMLRERPGSAVVISGRNRDKIRRIRACIDTGLHVFADKPWIVEASDLDELEAALDAASRKGVVALDAMTQRFEVTCVLARELAGDPAVFGEPLRGTVDGPAVSLESLHHVAKTVSGAPLTRPVWFFDIREQGEGLTDVGPHLADLVLWTLFPGRAVDPASLRVLRASRRPLVLTLDEFRRSTGEADFPPYLAGAVRDGRLEYFSNDEVDFEVGGIHGRLNTTWAFEAGPGEGDSEVSTYRGARATLEIRGGKQEGFVPQVYVIPTPAAFREVLAAVEVRIAALGGAYPGLAVEERGARLRIAIPDRHRIGHEAHFALLTERFLRAVRDPGSIPAWERTNMIAKYALTTRGVDLARKGKGEPR